MFGLSRQCSHYQIRRRIRKEATEMEKAEAVVGYVCHLHTDRILEGVCVCVRVCGGGGGGVVQCSIRE